MISVLPVGRFDRIDKFVGIDVAQDAVEHDTATTMMVRLRATPSRLNPIFLSKSARPPRSRFQHAALRTGCLAHPLTSLVPPAQREQGSQ